MILISSGQLIEQLGLNKTQRRFSFAQLTGSAELERTASEARALKRAEKPLDRVQQEALSGTDQNDAHLHAGRHIQFQLSRASAAGQFTSARSVDLSAEKPTAARVFLQSFRRILQSDLVLRDRPRNFNCGTAAQTQRRVAERRRSDCASRSHVSGKRNRDALPDCWPATGHE